MSRSSHDDSDQLAESLKPYTDLATYGLDKTESDERDKQVRAWAKRLDTDDLEAVWFEGSTTFFRDKGTWHVRLSDGGLDKPLRMEPRKDSPTAQAIFDLALSTHIERALPFVQSAVERVLDGEWITPGDRGGYESRLITMRQNGAGVFVRLRTEPARSPWPHLPGAPEISAHIYPSPEGLQISYVNHSGHQDNPLISALNTIGFALIANVPEFAGMTKNLTERLPRTTRGVVVNTDEVTMTRATEDASISVSLRRGERMGRVSLLRADAMGSQVNQSVLLTGETSVQFIIENDRGEPQMLHAAMDAINVRGGSEMIRIYVRNEFSYEYDGYDLRVGMGEDREGAWMGYLSLSASEESEKNRHGSMLVAFRTKNARNGREIEFLVGAQRGGIKLFADELQKYLLNILPGLRPMEGGVTSWFVSEF